MGRKYYIIEYVGKYSNRGNFYNGNTTIGEKMFGYRNNAKRFNSRKEAKEVVDKLENTFFYLQQFKVRMFIDTIDEQIVAFDLVYKYLIDNNFYQNNVRESCITIERPKYEVRIHKISALPNNKIKLEGNSATYSFIDNIERDKLNDLNTDIITIAKSFGLIK